MTSEQRGWEAEVGTLVRGRTAPEDLYPSERWFLEQVLPQVTSVLDVGCGAGGFSAIMRSINPAIRYTGVDITPAMVEAARRLHPGASFVICDAAGLPFEDCSFDLVFSSGVLHLNSRYAAIVGSAYRVARRWLLADLRVADRPAVGEFLLQGGDVLPYIVLDEAQSRRLLSDVEPTPRRILGRGYPIDPSPSARISPPLAAAFFLVERGPGDAHWDMKLHIDERERIG